MVSSPPDAPPPPIVASKLGGRTVTLNEQAEVFVDHPLPRYGYSGVKAYQARSSRGGAAIAYASDRKSIPRLQMAEKYITLQNIALARLITWGILKFPDGQEHYSLVYENNFGQPLVPMAGEALAYGMRSDLVFSGVIKPLAAMIQEMHNADLVHGGIRADNLYDGGVLPLQRVVIGDCLAQIYLGAQPMLYLPPNLAVAQPMGRGLGTPHDDMYAFGVTCALLLRSHDPMLGKSDEQIYLHKLDFGTFSTLIENERLPSNILELLRGLLQDDAAMRWTIGDVYDWFEGKRTTHRQGSKRLKASRHIVLGPEKILLPSVFAYYATRDVPSAVKLIENGEIKQWIRRSISDDKLDQRFDDAAQGGQDGEGSMSPERLVSRVCTAMEPTNPIVYRQLGLFPDSFGPVLAELMMTESDVKPVVDLINDQAVPYWMNMQPELPSDFNMMISRFEQCQQFLKQKTLGYGVERCVYFLTPELHCLSPSLKNFIVYTPEGLVGALNEIAASPSRPERVLDRHMVAFLSVRDRKLVDRYLPDLGSSEFYRQVSGTLSTLAVIQSRGKLPPMPALTAWLHMLCEPLYERFHDRDIRAMLTKKMTAMRNEGYLQKMVDLLFDAERMRRDQYDYRAGAYEYHTLAVEKTQLISALKHQHRFGVQAGRDMGALIAGVIMALAVAGFVLMQFMDGGVSW